MAAYCSTGCLSAIRFALLVKAAGITSGVTFHGLRHDHATRLFAQGEHPRNVQDRLGHAFITLTMDTYTHSMPSRQQAIASRQEANLPGSKPKPYTAATEAAATIIRSRWK